MIQKRPFCWPFFFTSVKVRVENKSRWSGRFVANKMLFSLLDQNAISVLQSVSRNRLHTRYSCLIKYFQLLKAIRKMSNEESQARKNQLWNRLRAQSMRNMQIWFRIGVENERVARVWEWLVIRIRG